MAKFLSDSGLLTLVQKIKEEFDSIYETIIDDEKVTASALTDINTKYNNINNAIDTIEDTIDTIESTIDNLANVATTGSYTDLSNTPTNVSSFNNDAGYLTQHQSLANYYSKTEVDNILDDVLGVDVTGLADIKAVLEDDDTTTGLINLIGSKANTSDLSTVATSGSYNDLSNKPSIPDDNNLVHKTGDENISGTKTFSNAQGTAPFAVNSTTKVINLNADYLDNWNSSTLMFANNGGFCAGTGSYWGKIIEGEKSSSGTVDLTATFLITDYTTAATGNIGILMIRIRAGSIGATPSVNANWVLVNDTNITGNIKVTTVYENSKRYIRMYAYASGWGHSLTAKILNAHGWSGQGGFTWTTYNATGAGYSVSTYSSIPSSETNITIGTKGIFNNAETATKLATERTLTIGNTGKTFNGSADKSWTLSEIGAAATTHTHASTDVKTPIVNHGTSDTTYELTPNVFHLWGEVSTLTLTLGAGETGYLFEYMFEFQSGNTATILTLPSTVKWPVTPTIVANKIYQVSIVNNIGLIIGVDV